jgi:hypothetical protein
MATHVAYHTLAPRPQIASSPRLHNATGYGMRCAA